MSNYNSIIEQNNTELEGILESVEALPDAENLDDVMDEQDSIIDQIQAALEGKAAASVETCTVVIQQSGGALLRAFGATCFDGKDFYPERDIATSNEIEMPHTIENVVCGTLLYVHIGAIMPNSSIVGGTSLGIYTGAVCYQITANPGETATITIREDD